MVIHGFKSFAKKTEVIFDKNINTVIGPNGSGKSNISDALCFALGRLSMKSMRTAKASNLIFMGSKLMKPAREAVVELYFDNTSRDFGLDADEVVLTRIVRRNGQSIYKINGEVKTRAEVIELLAQAGIDPHGFNLVLQGQIQSIVRMHGEERRKIVEEVAGISIYETRKERAMKELEKTDSKLKEISTILRERSSYLKNLEKEKEQAEKFKELEESVKKTKASIITKKLNEKKKEIENVEKSIEERNKQKEKLKEKYVKLQGELEILTDKINTINKHIQQSTGLEQESLRNDISNLRASLEGLRVRKESQEHRKDESERRIKELKASIPEIEKEIQELRKKSPLMAKKAEEVRKKKEELSQLEGERRKILSLKTELNSTRERIKDKERQLARNTSEGDHLLRNIDDISSKFIYKNVEDTQSHIEKIKERIKSRREELNKLHDDSIQNEKIIGVADIEIRRAEKIKEDVSKIDTCPLCQSKITEDHISHVYSDSDNRIKEHRDKSQRAKQELENIKSKREELMRELRENEEKLSKSEIELINQRNLKEKKDNLRKLTEEQDNIRKELQELEKKRDTLESKSLDSSKLEEEYERKIMEIEEISSRTEENVDTVLIYRERDLDASRNAIKINMQGLEELNKILMEHTRELKEKFALLKEKEEQERKLNEKFKKMFEERDKTQVQSQEASLELNDLNNEMRQIDDQANYLKIGLAKFVAEKESLEFEISEFHGVEIIQGTVAMLEDKLRKTQFLLQQIGNINMRALEVYQEVKKEYDVVFEKVQVLEKEKGDIMSIIEEIDKKKKREFMKSFHAVNEIFSQNFSKISTKGEAYLEIENKEDLFKGGVNIVVKMAKGKYFDVTSLSGGEQTMVALSLLFAIQEHKPYHFYIFDEIDAALDKRNSERLAGLLNQYMKAGQYIVVTHNDALITNSNILYGVSMHEGISKILSLRME